MHAAFAATAVCLTATYAYVALRHSLLSPVWLYLLLYAAAFGVYVYVGIRLLPHFQKRPDIYLPLIIVAGCIFRLMLLHSPPSISTDIYRYVWDGRLTTHGINPYQWSPFDPRLRAFRDAAIWYPLEYKYYNTVYMAASQAVFALTYLLVGSSLAGYKLVYILFDFGVIGLIATILKERKFPVTNVYWYAWCPLPIMEVALAGHQDVVGVFFMLLAVLIVVRKRPLRSGLCMVVAAFTKGFAFLLLPLFVRRYGKPFAKWAVVAFFVIGLPMWLKLPQFLHGMAQYLSTVHVNSGLFYLVNKALRSVIPAYSYQITSRLSNIVLLYMLWWSVKAEIRSDQELLRRATILIAVCLLTVPTLFPWYVLWLLPLALIFRPKPAASFIALSGSVVLMYLYYYDYMILWWFRALEYVPFFALLWGEVRAGYWLASPEPVDAGEAGGAGGAADSDVGAGDGSALPLAAK